VLFLIRTVASGVAALTFSKASLACAKLFSAVARNACVASILGELAGFAVVLRVSVRLQDWSMHESLQPPVR
jgi:hypothetical protein